MTAGHSDGSFLVVARVFPKGEGKGSPSVEGVAEGTYEVQSFPIPSSP